MEQVQEVLQTESHCKRKRQQTQKRNRKNIDEGIKSGRHEIRLEPYSTVKTREKSAKLATITALHITTLNSLFNLSLPFSKLMLSLTIFNWIGALMRWCKLSV